MEVTIRKAEEYDFNQIIDLFKEFAAFETLPDKMVNTVERMKAEKDLFNCYVAETKDKILIGYVTHFFCYYTWIGKSLYMDDLYVKPDFRGKGIGTSLIKKVIEYAKLTNCHKLRWQVSKWNTPAIDFYKSLGAEIDSTEQNCDLLLN
jgi:ribosomal protein S18 acetylase RimI-like enzyme